MNKTEQASRDAVAGPVEPTVMQHTPGPWALIVEDGDMKIVAPPQDPRLATRETLMCDMQYYPSVPGDEADWHLIAAAPDMLASLREVLAYFDAPDDGCFSDEALNRARAAVARAVGAA